MPAGKTALNLEAQEAPQPESTDQVASSSAEVASSPKRSKRKRHVNSSRMVGDRPDNFGQAMAKLARYCARWKVPIIVAVVLAMGGACLNIAGPSQLERITDLITAGMATGIDLPAVVRICLLLVGLYVAGYVLNIVQGIIMSMVTQKVSRSLRADIDQKINRVPLRYFDSTSIGNVLSRVTNDVDLVGQTLNHSLGTTVSAGTTFLGALVMMFWTNWIMALAAVLSTLLGFGACLTIIVASQKYFSLQQQELGRLNGHIEEAYSGQNVIKAFNAETEFRGVFRQMNKVLYDCAWKSQFLSGLMQPLMMFVGNFGYVVVCVVGAALALNGHISFGVIVAFMVYIRQFTQPLSQLSMTATSFQSTAAASERVFEFLDEAELEDESDKTPVLQNVRGDVEFKNVRFGYTPKRTIIKDFSAKVKAGQKVAIVGPTGAGKTTMVNLLMRFYEVDSGEILIDGIPTQSVPRENVHEQFCMVLQDTWLFSGTIRENITYAKQGVTDEQIEQACRAVGLHHFVMTLPDGYDTVLGENVDLSAGQKQLMTIARAMVQDSPMLILDEATSSVDTRTEVVIQRAMDKLMEGRTSFVIAHRLSTIRNSDLILAMRDGNIVESGTHESLLAKGGFYAELYNSQFAENQVQD